MNPLTPLRRSPRWLLVPVAVAVLAGCAVTPPADPPAPPAAAWRAPLPHQGDRAALAAWWSRFDDPLLPRLIDAAQSGSPGLAQAAARIAQARANLRAAGAAQQPAVAAGASLTRSGANAAQQSPALTLLAATADAQWEIDLFGGVARQREAAQARVAAGEAAWHDARVSLAAEVGQAYLGLRECEASAVVLEEDAASRKTTATLTRLKVDVGFEAPSSASLAEGSAADAAQRAVAQRAACDTLVKSLVELTGLDEAALRTDLAANTARLPQPTAFAVDPVPAQVLAQRPDLAAALRELAAAAADAGAADAQRYPQLSLSGSIGWSAARVAGGTLDGSTWSFGPALSVPLFDAGRREASRDAALARLDEQRAVVRQRARAAVREVETALVQLDAAQRREADATRAAEGYAAYFEAARQRWQLGSGSLIELEDARRTSLAARSALLAVQQARVAAWISLYKATGGGWDAQHGMPANTAGLTP